MNQFKIRRSRVEAGASLAAISAHQSGKGLPRPRMQNREEAPAQPVRTPEDSPAQPQQTPEDGAPPRRTREQQRSDRRQAPKRAPAA